MNVEKKYLVWMSGNDTGTSSKTMMSAILGFEVDRPDIPYDIADFGRCYRMLKQFPDLRSKIGSVINVHKEWMPFIDAWKGLERDYEECLLFESLPEIEQKKIIKKRGMSPNTSFWNFMERLVTASRYLRGMRFQNNKNSMSNKPPIEY